MKYKVCCMVVCLLAVVMMSSPSYAHKVNIFAWVEGNTVHTQSKFGGGRPAQDSVILVQDREGNLLLEGKTDDKGEFSFQAPAQQDMTVILKASMGHMAEWKLTAQDFNQPNTPITPAEPKSEPAADASLLSSTGKTSEIIASGLTREELQNLIDDALDKKLAPITRMLADLTDHRPGVTEIIGGIGYIIGLAGVALYMMSRKKGDHRA